MTSVISSLRRMLLNWPDAPANTRQVLESLLAELATPSADSYHVAGILAPLAPPPDADYRHLAFGRGCAISAAFIWKAAAGSAAVENASAIAEFNVPRRPAVSPPYRPGGGVAQRCPYLLRAGGDWRMGISTQWTSCAAALTLASICCVCSTPYPPRRFAR